MLTGRQQNVITVSGLAGGLLWWAALAKLAADRRERAELERRRELEAAAQAGAIAATIINAVVEHLDADLEAADCTDVLDLCPDPTRHEAASGDASC